VFAIFVMILYGLIAFGMVLAAKQSISQAAAEGARAAVGVVDDPATPQNEPEDVARQRVARSLDWLGSRLDPNDPSQVTIDFLGPTTTPACTGVGANVKCIRVAIHYAYNDNPLVPPAPGLGIVTPDRLDSTSIVQISQ